MKNQVKKSHANQAYQLYYHGMMLPGFIFLILFSFCSDVRRHHGLSGLQTRQRVFRF